MSFGVPWLTDPTGLKSFLVVVSFLLAATRHASLVSRTEPEFVGLKPEMVESANDVPPEVDRRKELFQAEDVSYDVDEYDGEYPGGLEPVGDQKPASRSTESGGHGLAAPAFAGGASASSSGAVDEETMSRLPQAIIIGVKKGGTRALLEFLRVHPKVRAPGPEVHFFDRHYDKGIDWYRSLMPPTSADQTTIEKTPSYFVTKSAPARVYNMSRSARLIVVVRDPVTRAVSDYTQVATKRRDQRSFAEMAFLDNATGPVATSWGAIKIGLYAKHLERWLGVFPRAQLHFVSGERLIDSPAAEMAKIEDFLGLGRFINAAHFYFNATKGFPCLLRGPVPHCLGKTKGRLHPSVDEKILRRLRSFYRPFNEKFYQMTGINFGWS